MCLVTKSELESNRSLPVLQHDGTRQRRTIRFTLGKHAAALVQPTILTMLPTTRHSPQPQRAPTLHQPSRPTTATATTFQPTPSVTTPTPTSTRIGTPCTRVRLPYTTQHLGATCIVAFSTRLPRPVTELALAVHVPTYHTPCFAHPPHSTRCTYLDFPTYCAPPVR